MKTSAVIRIITWSVVAVLLLALLLAGLTGGLTRLFGSWGWDWDWNWGGYSYSNSERYSAGSGSVSMQGIEDIQIDWTSGEVIVKTHEGSDITFSETGNYSDEDLKMHYLVEDGKLTIRYSASGMGWNIFNNINKKLEVNLPGELMLNNFTLCLAVGKRGKGGNRLYRVGIRADRHSGHHLQ